MEQTANYKLNKPGEEDYVSIDSINENMDVIDETLGNMTVAISFTAEEWSDGKINIAASAHKRTKEPFTCLVRHNANGIMKSTTWAAVCTNWYYDSDTGSVTLESADAYDGEVIFYGGV